MRSYQLDEPELLFGSARSAVHPKDGLFLFGPVEPRKAKEVRIGAVGSRDGLRRIDDWMRRVAKFIPAFNERAHHSPFPGAEAAFALSWPTTASHVIELPGGELERRIRYDDAHRRMYDTVDLIVSELLRFKRREDTQPDFWFIVLPEDVSKYGRPQSDVPREQRIATPDRLGKKAADRLGSAPVLFPDLERARTPYQYELNVHNQLKARLLEEQIVTQIVRETTLAPDEFLSLGRPTRSLQDPATTAWNLITTVYYKVAGPPWRLKKVRDHVCYVGLVFKVDPNRPKNERVCCGAQMFLASGEGVVFRGHLGPWHSQRPGEVHLDFDTAKTLIKEVVDSYSDEHGRPPLELFIHGTTRFTKTEWEGFEDGARGVGKLTAVQIRPSKELKLYRDKTVDSPGALPLMRGTVVQVGERDAYLWTNGFVPRLETYAGWETPNPIKVSVHRGDTAIRTVLEDVMGLTKLNFNACIFGDGLPVTLRFADAIGEILTAGPLGKNMKPLPFRHYI